VYKDKEKQKEAVKKAVDKHRGITKGITLEGITDKGITQYHPILDDLIDPIRRKKLEAISSALKRRNLGSKVYYGLGPNGLPMDVVGDLLDATEKG